MYRTTHRNFDKNLGEEKTTKSKDERLALKQVVTTKRKTTEAKKSK